MLVETVLLMWWVGHVVVLFLSSFVHSSFAEEQAKRQASSEGADDTSLSPTCECNWEENKWLYLVSNLYEIFVPTFSIEAREFAASRISNPSANSSFGPLLNLLSQFASDHELCHVDPSVMVGTNGARQRFEASRVEATVRAAISSKEHSDYLKELCLPGQISIDLLCSQHFTFLKARLAGDHSGSSWSSLSAQVVRRVHRLSSLVPFVESCLETSPWPLDVKALRNYADMVINGSTNSLYIFDPPSSTTSSARDKLPVAIRRCIPMLTLSGLGHCWPSKTNTLIESCVRCCDPRFPRGQTQCFGGAFTFEACCNPDDLEHGWAPAPPDVDMIQSGREPLEVTHLRQEIEAGCTDDKKNDAISREHEFVRDYAAHTTPQALAWEELRRWLATAKQHQGGLQRIFPELDLLVSTKACVGPQVELPWFVVRDHMTQKSDEKFLQTSGIELAAMHSAICGPGLHVDGEKVSKSGRRVTVPCETQSKANPESHKLETYALELMRPCDLARNCSCGAQWCDGRQSCCHEIANVEWRQIGLLVGELRSNIAHFARDALWLHKLLRGNATFSVLSSVLSETDFAKQSMDLVLTKFAATECLENGQCVKTGRYTILELESLMANIALKGANPFPKLFHAGDPARKHPICFEVVAQRWRPWATSGDMVQSFRSKALHECKVSDLGLRRKIVVIRRDSLSRRWRDEGAVNRMLASLALAMGSALYSINLGHLSPCEQIESLHDAMLLIGVHGADLTNMIFLPKGAAVVEVGVECEVEGASVDTPFWRGPGTLMNSSVYEEAADIWRSQSAEGHCPPPGAIVHDWLRGFPISQFAKLARQANLMYTAVMDCTAAACDREMPCVFDRGWCNSELKKKTFVDVDIDGKLLPTIWAIYDSYLRFHAPVV